jgi:multicomponent Na+:H+ antiporter subunit G
VTPPAPSFSAPIAELTGFDAHAVATALEWISVAPVLVGTLIVFTGALGVARFPDFYARVHPAGMIDALGQVLILGGLGIASDDPWIAIKLALISLVLFITAPTSTHAMVRAAWREGLRPWLKPGDAEGVLEKDNDENPATASAAWLRPKEDAGP